MSIKPIYQGPVNFLFFFFALPSQKTEAGLSFANFR